MTMVYDVDWKSGKEAIKSFPDAFQGWYEKNITGFWAVGKMMARTGQWTS